MSSRIPENPSEAEAEGIPDPGFSDPSQIVAGDTEATIEPPHDTGLAVEEWGTTVAEQAEGESLDGRLAREIPDDAPDVRPAEDPSRAGAQLEQDLGTTPRTDSGTGRTADDVEATADPVVGGEGPEAGAVHIIDG